MDSKTRVATTDQLTIVNTKYVVMTEVAGTRSQLTPNNCNKTAKINV